ncbi:TOBE domain-containing protein [Micrococcus luteus]
MRPESLVITEGEGIEVEVDTVEELGADAYVYGHTDIDGEERIITLRTVGYTAPEKGAVIRVAPEMERVHLFHTETGERLNG